MKKNLLMPVLDYDRTVFFLLSCSYMDKIDKDNSSSSGITFGEYNVQHWLFADDLALLSLNKSDLQHALDQFSDACLDAGIKISMTKTDIMCLKGTLPCLVFFPNKCSNTPTDV